MKKVKKVVAKKRGAVRSTTHRTVKPQITFYRRIFIFGSLAVILAIVIALPNKATIREAVAGANIHFGEFDQQTITLPQVPNAVVYNIYYKLTTESQYSNAVRDLPANLTAYTVSYLKANQTYDYKISAKDRTGKEFFWTPQQTFVASQPM